MSRICRHSATSTSSSNKRSMIPGYPFGSGYLRILQVAESTNLPGQANALSQSLTQTVTNWNWTLASPVPSTIQFHTSSYDALTQECYLAPSTPSERRQTTHVTLNWIIIWARRDILSPCTYRALHVARERSSDEVAFGNGSFAVMSLTVSTCKTIMHLLSCQSIGLTLFSFLFLWVWNNADRAKTVVRAVAWQIFCRVSLALPTRSSTPGGAMPCHFQTPIRFSISRFVGLCGSGHV